LKQYLFLIVFPVFFSVVIISCSNTSPLDGTDGKGGTPGSSGLDGEDGENGNYYAEMKLQGLFHWRIISVEIIYFLAQPGRTGTYQKAIISFTAGLVIRETHCFKMIWIPGTITFFR